MNYQKIYNSLIQRALTRELEGYGEKHHIVPRCLGGDNSSNNIVKLTAEEHFVAHLILARLHPKMRYLAVAILLMRGRKTKQYVKNSRFYAKLRERAAEASKKMNRSPETLKKLSDAARNMSQEQRDKISASLTGLKQSEATKLKRSKKALGRKHTEESKAKMRGPREDSAETKERRSLAKKGFKHSQESKAKMSESQKNRPAIKEETRLKLSAAIKGRKLSSEHIEAIRRANTGKPSVLRGVPRTEETKYKMSLGRRGKRLSDDAIARMAETKRGTTLSQEHKKKISEGVRRTFARMSERAAILSVWAAI
jgi:hypothetical protein